MKRSQMKRILFALLKTWESCQMGPDTCEEIIQLFEKCIPHLANEWELEKKRYVYYATDTNELFIAHYKVPDYVDPYSEYIGEL